MLTLNTIETKNILVIGDLILDTYYYGDVKRISPEAPVPVFRKKSERSVLGGAANVAANLTAARQNIYMMSVIGNDEAGQRLKSILTDQGINSDMVISADRKTTVKTRFLAPNNQQVLRLDVEDVDPISDNECEELVNQLKLKIHSIDLIIISDYLKGLLTYDLTQSVIRLANEIHKPVIIDVKDPNVEKYSGATLLKPNMKEVADLTGLPAETDEQVITASEKLKDLCKVDYVLTTCGGRGMVLVSDTDPYFISAYGQEVFDVTGAGDTTIAYLGACMANAMSLKESVNIANVAAGIQVSKVGTSCVYWSEIRERLSERAEGTIHKIISGKTVDTFRTDHQKQTVVFTNGCFDILHVGHVRYLQEAAKLGDVMVIGLNSDESVRRLKGPERPINSEAERAEMLASLGFVDYVVIFGENTPLNLINTIKPDVLVKGGDYAPNDVIGKKEVEDRGGKMVLIPFVEGKSTTNIIGKIKSGTAE